MATVADALSTNTAIENIYENPQNHSIRELNTAIARASARSRTSKASTATARPFSSFDTAQAQQTASTGFEYLKHATALLIFGIQFYITSLINIFHVCYFSYRKPDVAKDLIKTSYHLLKVAYDNGLLSKDEIFDIPTQNLLGPMARQNQHYFKQEHIRTEKLNSMRTGSTSSR